MDAGLRGRVVLITGGGGGAGPTFARAFAAEGAGLAVHYRGSADRAERVASGIRDAGGRALAVRADLTSSHEIDEMLGRVETELGVVAVAVNATSLYHEAPVEDTGDEAWFGTLDAMLGATFRVSRAVVPAMAAAGFGRIVNIASRSGLVGSPRLAAYVAAKAGIVGLTRTLAKELGPRGIMVNGIAPVYIVTDKGEGGRSISQEEEARRAKTNPLRRLATAEDVARVVVWLGSAFNTYVNGEVITLGGGARS